MAVRQYIGARYTIKVYENSLDPSSAEWESGRSWEPIVLVTYNNSSYLSKKDVPSSVGDPAANPEYWVCTGYYNGQILTLQQQIDTINNIDLPAITSNITELQDNVRGVFDYSDNDDVIVIGDSWTNGIHATHGLWHWLNLYLPHNNFYHNQENGAGFKAQGESGHTFEDLITAIAGNISDPDKIRHIIFLGGLNDQGLTGVGAAIDSCITYCHTTYPNAGIELVAVNRMQFGAIDRYDYCTQMFAGACSFPYVRFFDLTHVVQAQYFYNTSHLDENGYTFMSYTICNALVSGTISCGVRRNQSTGSDSALGISTTFYQWQTANGSVEITSPVINVSGSYAITGLIKRIHFVLDTNMTGTDSIQFQTIAYVTDSNGSYTMPANVLMTSEKDIYIEWYHSNANDPYTSIYIPAFSLKFGLVY